MIGAVASVWGVQAASAATSPIEVKAETDRSVFPTRAGSKAYLRITIETSRQASEKRAPMNLALVVDRSGSMSSDRKMANARRAAEMAVDKLGPDDILSVISYDDKVDVDVPTTKVSDPQQVKNRIAELEPRGSTAIHAALLAAANEVRKFKSRERVNRIILLSDGLANVGPSEPEHFVSLGRELASEGITVSTIGLGNGYNEDLMAGLARSADGGHVYAQESEDLANFLSREFDDSLNVVGQDVEIIIKIKDGVRPLRTLGRDAEIHDDRIVYRLGSIGSGKSHVLLAELDVGAGRAEGAADLASVEVNYKAAGTGETRSAAATATARFAADADLSEKSLNASVMKDVATMNSRAQRQEAVKLRDAGRTAEAKRKFEQAADYVRTQQSKLPGAADYTPLTDELKASEAGASREADTAEGWSKARKYQRETDGNKSGATTKF